jgi:hypothetical protein
MNKGVLGELKGFDMTRAQGLGAPLNWSVIWANLCSPPGRRPVTSGRSGRARGCLELLAPPPREDQTTACLSAELVRAADFWPWQHFLFRCHGASELAI